MPARTTWLNAVRLSKVNHKDTSTVPRIIHFLRLWDISLVNHTVTKWKGTVLTLCHWPPGATNGWALAIRLGGLGIRGEEGYVPFQWSHARKPSIEDAVEIIRRHV